MKKIFLVTILLITSFISASACEICGCGIGNYYIGLLPQFNHRFFGLRYQFKSFHTSIKNEPTEFSRDRYTTVELWGGWNIGKRWQVLVMLPFNHVHQVSDDGTVTNSGLGDIAVIGNYKLFDKATRSGSQQLWVGAGIKVPTGKFNIEDPADDLVSKSNIQTGSGSTDFMLNSMYNVRINRIGINTAASYKFNTDNKNDYQFGNKFSSSSFVSYSISKGNTTILPNAGIMYEHTAANKLQHEKVEQTGGNLFATAIGIEVSIKKITIGANVQLPVSQNFAEGQTETKVRAMAHVTFSL